MNRPMVRIHNATTGEIIDREMNDEEFADAENRKLKEEAELAEIANVASKREALLEKLGIDAEEAKLLLS